MFQPNRLVRDIWAVEPGSPFRQFVVRPFSSRGTFPVVVCCHGKNGWRGVGLMTETAATEGAEGKKNVIPSQFGSPSAAAAMKGCKFCFSRVNGWS
jgi:hypothetical protein